MHRQSLTSRLRCGGLLGVGLALAALALGAATPAFAGRVRPQILESASFSQPDTFAAPTGIAIDQATGNVYVADSEAGVVDISGAAGGSPADGVPSQITGLEFRAFEPEGVAVDNSCYYHEPRLSGGACEAYDPSNGDVYVAESSGRTVAKFKLNSSSGEYELAEDLAYGSEPNGVAVDTIGDVYVTNQREGAITEFGSTGVEIGKIEQHTFGTPAFVAVGAPGIVYVGNYSGPVVKLEVGPGDSVEHEEVFNTESEAVAVGPQGTVLVDAESHIAEYTSSGLLEGGFGAGLFRESAGVAINDETGYIYVTDRGENRDIDVFGTPVVVPEAIIGTASIDKTTNGLIHIAVSGTVNPENTSVTSCEFEYGLSSNQAAYEHTESCAQSLPLTGETPLPVSAELNGLQSNTTYRYRVTAGNASGDSNSAEKRFTTNVSPSLTGQPPSASNANRTSVLIEATINTENESSGYDVEYVRQAEYQPAATEPYAAGATTTPASLGASIGDQLETISITSLRPETTYDYRLSATNQAGTEHGPNYTFTTAAATPPAVSTGEATEIGQTTAVLTGSANPEGLQTTYRFELGANTEYGTVITGSTGSEAGEQSLTANLQYLEPGVTYHYRLVASNADGTTYGGDRTFTTTGFGYPLGQSASASSPNLGGLTPLPPPKTTALSTAKGPPPTKAEQLAKMLKKCKTYRAKRKRQNCEKEARMKYGTKAKAKGKKRRSRV